MDQILTITTGELLQPVRLHYDLISKNEILRIFNKLGCINFDASRHRWAWTYSREAKSLKFKYSYHYLPKELHDVVLGSFYITSDTKMHLDVRSIERVIAAVEFFHPRMRPKIAKLNYLSIVNRLISDPKELPEDFDLLFDCEEVRNFNPEAAQAKRIKNFKLGVKSSMPDLECLPMHNYEYQYGLDHLRTMLDLRQGVAFKHFQGDIDYSLEDYIRDIMGAKIPDK